MIEEIDLTVNVDAECATAMGQGALIVLLVIVNDVEHHNTRGMRST